MSEKFEQSKKYSEEEVEFFNNLADKYNLEQTPDQLVLTKGTKKTYIPKWHHIPLENNSSIEIEEFIKKIIGEK